MALSPTSGSREHRIKVIELTTGLYTGALLTAVMIGALIAANRVPGFERYALERNAVCAGFFVIFMLIPIVRFLRHPAQIFISGIIAWVIFVIAYDLAGFFFRNLFEVLRRPLEVLVEGGIVYGVASAGSWVGGMMMNARRHHYEPHRDHSSDVSPHKS